MDTKLVQYLKIHYINKLRKKTHMIMLIEALKTFNKIQKSFVLEILRKIAIGGNFLNLL